jgi:hypothetical protein
VCPTGASCKRAEGGIVLVNEAVWAIPNPRFRTYGAAPTVDDRAGSPDDTPPGERLLRWVDRLLSLTKEPGCAGALQPTPWSLNQATIRAQASLASSGR